MLRSTKNALRRIEGYAAKRYLRRYGFEFARDARPQDTVIIGFPKSGHTWMQALIAGLKYGVDAGVADDAFIQALVPDLHQGRIYQRMSPTMCFKCHHLPRASFKRVIYLIRDGRDVMVSYFHYRQALGYSGQLENLMDERNPVYATWWEHVDQWQRNPYGAEILFIYYENLVKSPAKELLNISTFLNLETSYSDAERIAQWCEFSRLRQREVKKGWSTNWPENKPFIRRGIAGSYQDEMSRKDRLQFEALACDTLRRLGYSLCS